MSLNLCLTCTAAIGCRIKEFLVHRGVIEITALGKILFSSCVELILLNLHPNRSGLNN